MVSTHTVEAMETDAVSRSNTDGVEASSKLSYYFPGLIARDGVGRVQRINVDLRRGSMTSTSDSFSCTAGATGDGKTYWLVLIIEGFIKYPRKDVLVGDRDGFLSKKRHFDGSFEQIYSLQQI